MVDSSVSTSIADPQLKGNRLAESFHQQILGNNAAGGI